MTTDQIITQIRKRRRDNVAKSNSALKARIHELRRQIVELSFSAEADLMQHRALLQELEEAKLKLKQVNAFGG